MRLRSAFPRALATPASALARAGSSAPACSLGGSSPARENERIGLPLASGRPRVRSSHARALGLVGSSHAPGLAGSSHAPAPRRIALRRATFERAAHPRAILPPPHRLLAPADWSHAKAAESRINQKAEGDASLAVKSSPTAPTSLSKLRAAQGSSSAARSAESLGGAKVSATSSDKSKAAREESCRSLRHATKRSSPRRLRGRRTEESSRRRRWLAERKLDAES
mmetsp:Transcript_17920/g.45444  ORF Transcript_17920/g.45444 Transcript_17920/m.45444 type:complete len:225 (+) Transcript_17920:133-807(+)